MIPKATYLAKLSLLYTRLTQLSYGLPKTSEPVNHVTTYHTEDYHIPLEHARHPYLTMLHVLNEKKHFF